MSTYTVTESCSNSQNDDEKVVRQLLHENEYTSLNGKRASCGLFSMIRQSLRSACLFWRDVRPLSLLPLWRNDGLHDAEADLLKPRDLTPFITFDEKRPFAISPCSDLYKPRLLHEYIVAVRRIRFQDDADEAEDKLVNVMFLLMRARHVNILGYLGTCYYGGSLCIVSPFVGGGDLKKYLVAHPECNRKNLLSQVAKGLEHLHRLKIVHGNLHPRNVLVAEDATAKLSEFGLFDIIPDEGSTSMRPAHGREKAMHRAPEIHMGEPVAPSCDVYSLGMLTFYAYSDKEPMIERCPNSIQVAAALLSGRRPERREITRPDFSNELWEMVQWCWVHEKEKRPSLIAGELDHYLSGRISTRSSLTEEHRKLV